jgi:Fe-S cluster assembly iron-binding protein IscA
MSISNFLDIDSWGDHGFDKNFDFEEMEMISVQQEDILRSITAQQFRVIPVSMSILKGVLFDEEFLVT